MIDTFSYETIPSARQESLDPSFANRVVEDLVLKGYTVQPNSLPPSLLVAL